MTIRTITNETARRLAISKQRLASQAAAQTAQPSSTDAAKSVPTTAKGRRKKTNGGAADGGVDADALYNVIRDLGCLQLDPISAVARSHQLVLWSRVGSYDVGALDDLMFKQRRLFEYWAHEASIVLTEDYPLHQHRMRHYVTDNSGWSTRVRDWLTSNAALHDHIRLHLQEKGAAFSRDLQADGLDPEHWVSSGWTGGRNVSRMLDFMWSKGEIMVTGRAGGQKQWDLTERVLPDWTPREDIDAREVTRRAARKAIGALGVAREGHIKLHFIRRRYTDLPHILKELESAGEIVRLKVEGQQGEWYMNAADQGLLDQIEQDGWQGRTILLSPFDNLICDRARTKALFNFLYSIEIYVPAEKRQYGYYVLPILHGDRLVGRVDPTFERKTRTLRINNLYAEADAPRDAAKGIRAAVESLAGFIGAERIEGGSPPPKVWQALGKW